MSASNQDSRNNCLPLLQTNNARESSNLFFSRRNAAGNLEETYVSHLKIWEDPGPEGGGRKPRYILLSQSINGNGFIHKSKLNNNGTYSVGKTWRLPELRAVSVTGPMSFNMSLSRTYRWQTENAQDQETFIRALVQLFQTVTGGAPLRVEGLSNGDNVQSGRQRIQNDYMRSSQSASPNGASSSNLGVSPQKRTPSPTPVTQTRSSVRSTSPNGAPSYNMQSLGASTRRLPSPSPRPSSPAETSRSDATVTNRSRPRPPSPARSTTSTASRRRPSNADSSRNMNGSIPVPLPPALKSSSSQSSSQTLDNLSVIPPSESSSQKSRPPSPSTRTRKPPVRTATGLSTTDPSRRDQNARISFFDPANQMTIDRLISGSGDLDGEEENAQATMTIVEEMIEGYEWASDDIISRRAPRGAADLIEARLLDELTALEKANIHSFLESDDRINTVLKFMDDAMAELDTIGSLVSTYKIHLNAVSDDISFIQSQNRGLQVQTQNQRALLAELENLVQTVQVDSETLIILTQESLEKSPSIQRLEEAAAELYKALLAGRDMDMAATMERLQEYKTHNSQFCKRIFDFLSIMFTAQSKLLLGDSDGLTKSDKNRRPTIIPHTEWEAYLGRYSGLMLYLKEMDEGVYGKLCAAYFSAASILHGAQVKALLSAYLSFIKKPSEDGQGENLSNTTPTMSKASSGMKRAGTIIRSPLEGRNKDKDKGSDGDMRASEVFALILDQIAPMIYREDDFLADFLQINDVALSFADYMGLDNYFRRQAARSTGLSAATMKLVRGALELIFGFVPSELKSWLDAALVRDNMEIIGLIASLERFLADAEDRSNNILLDMLGRQHTRLKGLFDRHVNEQIQAVEQTKLTSKKRNGVAPFIKRFPFYISRVEAQLLSADGLEIRMSVDAAYERIVDTMFESLKQMAKMDGEGEDKGQLNYHVIVTENMHHFVAETSEMEIGSVASFVKKAEAIYEENVTAYVKIVLRRPFSKIIDFFEGVERLLKTTAASEIASNANYNRSALKKVVKEYNAKDVRKHIDSLFKRVEKHFTEERAAGDEGKGLAPGTVMVDVWKACQDELIRITKLFSKTIAQCYPDAGVSLEYSVGDVESSFKRHTIGS
ncbi:hypothetical protein D9758_000450 [Tetrapyrgos nigripes]|uniref:Exocyst complex component Sec3 PIP2-binding N-terminal domain-containing protein n=1 Tax=Tetrapyrgos nigripes TaxID=182062 RepID=A0A8H5H1T9_9AGAR|nr:hypothetical protein D9758_000450 [Tetrapyrgos nigripes]